MEKNDLLINIVLFSPVVGLVINLLLSGQREERIKWGALIASLVTLLATLVMLSGFDQTKAGLQFESLGTWFSLGNYTITYHLAVDGLSVLLVVLTAFIMPLAILFSLYYVKERVRLYYSFLLLLEFAMLGVFLAQDLFLFYVFWEISLVPMYFIVGIWGSEQRIYAAVKFFLYTMAGSILMLLAILWMGGHFGTFNVPEIKAAITAAAATPVGAFPSATVELLLFLGFFIAFAIKVPVWPLHSWLPDAHVQAPTAGSVILAGVLLKLGTYGMVRFNIGLFPQLSVQMAPIIGVLAVIGIIYGAWVSYAQTDVKKLVAYSSISHLGFVVLGIFALNAAGISGATLQMVNHGISTGGLFLLVGMLYERRHTKAIDAFGGVWKVMPVFSGLALVINLSSMGLPGLNGFVGEFTILLGAFGSPVLGFWFAFFATFGVIMAAVYLLYMWNKVFMGEYKVPGAETAMVVASGDGGAALQLSAQGGGGEPTPEVHTEHAEHGDHGHGGHDAHAGHEDHGHGNPYPPMMWNEATALVIVVIAALVIGLFPRPFFGYMDASVAATAAEVQRYLPATTPAPAE